MVRLKHRWTIGVLEQSGRSKTAFSRHDIRDAIQEEVATLFGDFGIGAMVGSLQVRFYSPTTGIVVIRYGRDFHKLATAAIASVTAVKAAPVCIHGVHVCGSQRTLASAITRITKEQCDNIGIPFKGTPLLELAKGFTSIEGNTTQ